MNNSNDHNDKKPDWLKSALNELDENVTNMDSVDASRLSAARQAAYREAQSQRSQSLAERLSHRFNWQSGFVLACTVAVVATVAFNLNVQEASQEVEIVTAPLEAKPKISIEVIPLLTAKEELEFYESVNFLLWLENKQGKS